MAAVFVVNLLKRHPNCQVLLHRKNADEFSYAAGEDPYDMDQKDPASSNALDSCLWELKVHTCMHKTECSNICECRTCVSVKVSHSHGIRSSVSYMQLFLLVDTDRQNRLGNSNKSLTTLSAIADCSSSYSLLHADSLTLSEKSCSHKISSGLVESERPMWG